MSAFSESSSFICSSFLNRASTSRWSVVRSLMASSGFAALPDGADFFFWLVSSRGVGMGDPFPLSDRGDGRRDHRSEASPDRLNVTAAPSFRHARSPLVCWNKRRSDALFQLQRQPEARAITAHGEADEQQRNSSGL